MSANAFGKALSRDTILQAWREIYQNSSSASRNTLSSDEISINDFEHHYKNHLAHLGRDLRSDKFQFQSLRPYLIPKPNGKFRLICVPTVRDRIVQRALVNYLSEKYRSQLANKISYGFIKGRSVKQAAKAGCALRASKPWVFKTDITAFFDNIKRETLIAGLKKIVRDSSLHNVLRGAIACEVHTSSNGTKKQIESLGIKHGQGIRQGMPLSPLFSNILLSPFDEQVQKKEISAIRYADDLIFFAKSKDECVGIASFCETELAKLGLKIPPVGPESKSVIYEPGEAADFLGLELAVSGCSYQLRLSQKQIERIKDELLQYGSIGELLARKITLRNLGQILTNKKNGYLAAYDVCENLPGVEAALADVEQKVLRRVYTNGLGINLSTISREAKTFLNLIS
ncbi:group II intron reverse transcriptase/maturase [Collimonas sp. OK307]|uniref:reverse transcriptase domain-containing protein n=1 Tax=Collimonas sp. OK307 TaxID=1801620 RepID=UPI0008E387C5|nr:reverse transcriptase domain-containing protein [Collimonas sp. OK307]SFI02902.1 group II intron reverse transcriptase/maturase [Collimonas sp. OK307]